MKAKSDISYQKSEKKMTLMQHFIELRRRLMWVLAIFFIAFGIGWFMGPTVQGFLLQPLMSVWPGGQMLYTGLVDGLMIQFSMATLIAIIITLPAALWHIWAFVSPGLRDKERKLIFPILILAPILFIIGAAFAFYILFPLAFQTFIEVNQASPVPTAIMPSMTEYLEFTIELLKIFGLAFQLPLVLVILNKLGILSRKAAGKMRRYVIVGIFIVAAILTPPDVFSQCLLAFPLWALFEISILFMKKEPKQEKV